MAKILVVDDEPSILESLDMFLREKGHKVCKAATGAEGITLFQEIGPEVVILDIRLPDRNGLDLLELFQRAPSATKIIMMTAFHDMETTIEAMKRGAYDYIHKPLDASEVERAVQRALHILEIDRETPLAEGINRPLNPGVIVGECEKMREIFKMIGLLCQNRATVLIQGETGTGKELIARVIHRNSLYSEEPFVIVDCATLVETLLESELFGHDSGAFTGATYTKKGKIELAGMGTLFLDEVGELPLGLQAKFLGFLQRREYMRVGGQKTLESRCRIIAATSRDLASFVQEGRFRQDFYFRLRVVTIHAPALRDRIEEIPAMVHHFLQKLNLEMGTEVTKLEPGVLESLMAHTWTGNVRELENVLVEALVTARGKVLLREGIDAILSKNHTSDGSRLLSFSLPEKEKEHIQNTLRHLGWNRTRAAKVLGISLPTLRKKIEKYALAPS